MTPTTAMPKAPAKTRGASVPVRGFTLIELMIAVAVAAILASIAVPSYQSYVRKARRADAHEALMRVRIEQEKWRSYRTQYTTDLGSTGLKMGTKLSDEHYAIAITAASETTFTATATAKSTSSQAKDTGCTVITLKLEEGGVETRTPDKCW